MPTSTVILDTPELQIVETTSLPERDPSLPGGWRGRNVVWKTGSSGANEKTLRDHAQQALANNGTVNPPAGYLGHAAVPAGTLTTAQLSPIVRQLTDQVDALTKQCNALIRLAVGQLDDTAGT